MPTEPSAQSTHDAEWQLETRHLAETLAIVKDERRKIERSLGAQEGEDRLVQVNDDSTNESVVQLFLMRTKLNLLRQLRLSEKQTYFARLDFIPDSNTHTPSSLRSDQKNALYIGRWGVIKTPEQQICVVDWRSPVANLYYSGQIGRVSYEAPDGKVEGEMNLKRMLSVTDGVLEGMQDTGLADQERYLMDALSQVTTAKLREIVTTIQAEQNDVIRHDPEKPLCVQGVAGSGKTSIALHRIAWILYRLQQSVSPEQLMILAPNPLFLSYINRVLPDLGVENVRQTTFADLCASLMKKHMPRLAAADHLGERLRMNKRERDALDTILKRKGALTLYDDIHRFLKDYEQRCLPKRDFSIGDSLLLTTDEIKRYFMIECRSFPLQMRVGEVRKVLCNRLQTTEEHVTDKLLAAVEERLERLLNAMPDNEERRQKARRLFDGRDALLKQLQERRDAVLKEFDESWQTMELCGVYRAFWEDMAARDPSNQVVLDAVTPLTSKKRVLPEDLPALMLLAKGLYGFKNMNIKHVVIDEAQDISPLEVRVLRTLFGHDAFTLVGDLCQGVYGDEGLRSWEDIGQGVFDIKPETIRLSVAYRSTTEIMNTAFSVIARHPVEGVGTARPVLRHGEVPELIHAKNMQERVSLAAKQIARWRDEGFMNIAVIVKTEASARALHLPLLAAIPDARLVKRGDELFDAGIQIMDASLVKGLEFDCVLIADADEDTYPDERFYAKMFYVLCTRALHRLKFIAIGRETAHLSSRPQA